MTVEIIKKLDKANEKLDTLLQWREGLEARCEAHRNQTDEVRTTTLFGNPGLKSQVQTLMHGRSRWRDFYLNTLTIVITTLVVSFVVWMLAIWRTVN